MAKNVNRGRRVYDGSDAMGLRVVPEQRMHCDFEDACIKKEAGNKPIGAKKIGTEIILHTCGKESFSVLKTLAVPPP